MNRRIIAAAGVVATLVLGGVASDAFATCDSGQLFKLSFGNGTDRNFTFGNAPGAITAVAPGGPFIGRWWKAGNFAGSNDGRGTATACPENTWIITNPAGGLGTAQSFFGAEGGDWGQGTCDNVGPCVSGDKIVLLETLSADNSNAFYAVGKAAQNAGFEHDFTEGGATDWDFKPIPRPRVTNSSRGGSTVTVNLAFDPPAGARGEQGGFAPESILTGYQLVRSEGLADPGRLAASWSNLGAVIPVSAGGATVGGVGAVCGGTSSDVFLAMRPIFDNGQYAGDYVGASTRVECDPAVADPRFKMIDRSKSGRGDIRSNPR